MKIAPALAAPLLLAARRHDVQETSAARQRTASPVPVSAKASMSTAPLSPRWQDRGQPVLDERPLRLGPGGRGCP